MFESMKRKARKAGNVLGKATDAAGKKIHEASDAVKEKMARPSITTIDEAKEELQLDLKRGLSVFDEIELKEDTDALALRDEIVNLAMQKIEDHMLVETPDDASE